ncbi:MAG TPA: ATP-binding cassette domain-containing protein [Tepidisphaeraceae bacterium]|nr:ATP-binding cassette domain-containing protein [Tepidisphaeraceae bacterium]
MNAIELTNVTKTFGKHVAVDRLSLAVPAGSIYGFIGPNGSGKTTTLRMIMRIYLPDSGSVRVLGDDHHNALDKVTYLPEERMLYKSMKVYDVLKFFSSLKGHSTNRAEMDQWLARLKLDGWGDKKVEALSKGMTQKVQLIACLISKPSVVLLDEPFSGLDPVNAVVLRDAIFDLRKTGTTVIFSTHDMSVAEKMCDRIFMIYKGKKVLDGTLETIQQQYGRDTIRVRMAGGNNGSLSGLPGVTGVVDHGNLQELRVSADANPQVVLHALAERGAVEHFEVAAPNLHDIFVRIAAPDDQQFGEKVLA